MTYAAFRASDAGKAYHARLASERRAISLMRDARKAVPCADCGQRFPAACMDFDHKNPADKTAAVSMLSGRRWRTTVAEMDKCDVVCANCHRVRSAIQRGVF